jgi:ABC-type bacteriocin/lantibiotic exporter with double-glycine peptidase domain
MNGLQTIETLKATGSESDFFVRWSGYHAKAENARQSLGLYTESLTVIPPMLAAINMALILGLGALRVMAGAMTVGMLVAFQSLTLLFLVPVTNLVQAGSLFQDLSGSIKRLDDVLHYTIDPQLSAVTTSEPTTSKLAGYLELRNISFGYNRLDAPLIEHFNLVLKPGDRVALVGGSGSGKSTIARLVAGLYQPWAGEILLDGQQWQAVCPAVRQQSLTLVDQEIFLFEGSVRENLTLWDPTLPEPIIIQAARDACIHEDVAARPGGYDSPVEEGGRNFSGGQRQRLEVARALVSNPAILILDEATSALDAITEEQIDDNLRRRGCTCLIVAHRLSTIRDCDEIIVLDRGRVVQRGRHDDLIAIEGPYRRLIIAE